MVSIVADAAADSPISVRITRTTVIYHSLKRHVVSYDLPFTLTIVFRRTDGVTQVHVEDLLRSGLIDKSLAERLPEDLRNRLREIRDTMEWFTEPPSF